MWFNPMIETAIIANILAQFVKIPTHYLKYRHWNLGILLSTGGMPSSHASFVASLATAVALNTGIRSPYFAIAFCFAAVTIYDAMGIRRHAGKNAALLNKLISDLKESPKLVQKLSEPLYQKQLKELLGHEPLETFWGTMFGILVAYVYHSIYLTIR